MYLLSGGDTKVITVFWSVCSLMETGFIFMLQKEDEILLWQDCLLPVFFLKHLIFFKKTTRFSLRLIPFLCSLWFKNCILILHELGREHSTLYFT